MSKDIEQRIKSYFQSPLKEGEQRKILYLFDEEQTYLETINELSRETDLFKVLEVYPTNYFYVQYQVERKLTDDHLFLYYSMAEPTIQENPLLDILLYSEELKVDQESQLYLTIGINPDEAELKEVVEAYPVFFRSKERIQRFKRIFHLTPFRTKETVEYSILAALVRAGAPDWMAVLIELFEEEVNSKETKWDAVVKFGNEERFWELVESLVGYSQETSASGRRSIKELMHQVFLTHLDIELEGDSPSAVKKYLLPKANPVMVFLNQWMNARDKEESYVKVANAIQDNFVMEELFEGTPSTVLAQPETFQWFDQAFIRQMISSVSSGVMDTERQSQLLSKRRNTFWYPRFREMYHFLHWAIRLVHYIEQFTESFTRLTQVEEVWNQYYQQMYHIDQAYRKLYTYYDQLDNEWKEAASDLHSQMERLYTQQFLAVFSEKWDRLYTNSQSFADQKLQNNFFSAEVQAFVENDRRVFVIISDGLRYEAGKELFLNLTKEKRFNGEIDWMQTELPSITAVGMASLLPHKKVQLMENGEVLVDGRSTSGIANREAILKENGHPDSIAVQADQLNQMNQAELRNLVAGKKVMYIYHNRVDAIGDHRPTEHGVFQATEESIEQIKRLMSRLTVEVSASQFLVTADHGYLYTRSSVQPTEKVVVEKDIDAWIKNKRFILSEKSVEEYSSLSFQLSERLETEGYVTVPRGMNRFALQGGGYQYVHGGHLPQEMMVPLLRIKTERGRNEIPEVGVALVSQTRTITNSVVWLNFLQLEPISEAKKEKRLNLYFEDSKGRKISNEVTLIADSENGSSEDRVFNEKFVLLSNHYQAAQNYYFVMENANDKTEITKETFKIDIV
ncbi:BREX-1 system phosphatase PglZ type A [Desemzia sp. C1]|uniref:BREX-1 system phosphatase PglZ type A n=1 Tax=Desemzia sp. C1 TaxID=2892016 RepID=UPI001E581DCD|nr:BREX-1 system phosphatase PglZ type A [Desemzia sp. C1]MCI3028210.1 BREX-1 system phosphatase PglZ type A [Desemzia sp. C1]